ncbi:hypothetical protein niasHT_039007 [Heterodera trifolii]|uniref:Uncharacterized protein n=1 Tax=Heterodera trifolii TaxID=157864 RepID=A0ABD2J1K1_9BILA
MNNANANASGADGQFLALAISNFVPDQLSLCCSSSACSSSAACAATPSPLPIFVGDYLRVICSHGQWCFGHRINGCGAKTMPATVAAAEVAHGQQQQQKWHGQKCGIFPRSHVRPLGKKRLKATAPAFKQPKNGNSGGANCEKDEAMEMVAEITESAKTWWQRTKSLYGAVNSSKTACEEHICRIRELMALRRRLRSGTVPTEELRELRLGIARLLDAGNAALHLPMNIRDSSGRTIVTDDLSVIASYKLHEEANARIAAQQQQQQEGGGEGQEQEKHSPLTVIPSTETADTVQSGDKLLAQQQQSILLTLEHPQQQIASGTVELVLGLGHKAKSSTCPISEPLTIFLDRKMANRSSDRQSRALFVGMSEKELADEQNGLTLWATALRVGPLPGTGTLGKSTGTTAAGEEVRQFYAHGHVDIGELCWDMAEKEQREFTLTLHKKMDPPIPAICRQFPAGSNAAVPYPAAASNCGSFGTTAGIGAAGDNKICLNGTAQRLSRAATAAPAYEGVQSLRMLKSSDDCCTYDEGASSDEHIMPRRNEVFIWLRSADLHGVGKSEKTIEASISVVDDEGVFQPEAIEIVTPDGVRHQSTFRCRVWFSEDRPKLNELIKICLPKGEVRNLHLQILFHNKLTGNDKKLLSSSSPSGGPGGAKGPFALAFLRLINNYILCEEDEDELVVYKVEKRQSSSSGGPRASVPNESGGTRPISVAYLSQWATRKEMLLRPRAQSSTVGAGAAAACGAGTMSRHEMSTLNVGIGTANGGGAVPYAVQSDKNNGVQFVSFVNSMLHTTNPILLQILRWKDNGQQLLSQRMHEFCLALGDQRRHDGMVKELRKFLRNILDALFQIAAAIVPLQRNVFDALAYICHFCGQLPPFKLNLEQYIYSTHCPKAFTFILHHIVWYIESEGSDALCVSSSSAAAFHDKLMTVLSSLHSLVQFAIASKRCAKLIRDSSKEQQHQNENDEFKQYMDSVFAAIRRLLMGPGRRVTCQNLAMRQLASSILGPMASAEDIYEPTELAKYAIQVLDSLSEGVLMSQRLHFVGELIETKLFAIAECRALLLCRCLDELASLMPPHARDEVPCVGGGVTPFTHRSRSRSEYSLGTAAVASGDDSSSSNITLLESVQQSARIMANLVELLFPPNGVVVSGGATFDELQLVLRKCFRPLNQTMVTLLGDPTHQRTLHALLLGLLDKFSAENFDAYFRSLSNQLERLDTLSEMLHMFRDLLLRCPVPAEWQSLRRIQLRLFAKHLRMSAALCRRDFGTPAHFDAAIWCECILSCVALAKCCATTTTQKRTMAAQSDEAEKNGTTHSDYEEEKVSCDQQIDNADDAEQKLGKYATEILRALWFSLVPESKCQLMPHITGPLLEMAFAGTFLCEFAVSIFVDMLITELQINSSSDVVVVRRRKKVENKQHHQNLFSDVFINRLDPLLDFSLADAPFGTFRRVFSRAFQRHCVEQSVAADQQFAFRSFVQIVDRLLELFAAYRSVQHGTGDQMAELGMFCTAQLVDFYQSIEHHELYVLYVYKLYTLHRTVGNWVEAGLTLKRHADLLRWSTSHRPESFLCGTARKSGGTEFGTELELKEYIYKEMVELFTQGEHWELAIETNRELANIYETATFDFAKLADLLARNAALYDKVTKTLRMESHYFMIAFYGKSCPSHLVNLKFVARGRPLEQWGCFKQRLVANFSDFKFVDTLDNCEETYREMDGKFLQIVPVTPIPLKEVYAKLLQNSPCRLASWYYKHHRIQRFELIRREFRTDTKWTKLEDNETTRLWLHKRIIQIQRPLPDLLSMGPVVSELDLDPLNPVEVAIEKMREANDKLAETAAMVGEGFAQSLVNLAGMIRGIVQADVGGGIRNYQPFFSEESYAVCTEEERNAIGTLKRLILEQTSLLEYALYIHSQSERAQANALFHNSLAGSFMEHRQRVEHWLGPVKSVLPEKTSIYMLEATAAAAAVETMTSLSHAVTDGSGGRNQTAQQLPAVSSTPPPQQKLTRMTSLHENGMMATNNNMMIYQQQARPISMGSSVASGGSLSPSSNPFKSSNLGAALLKTTIQARAKLKQKANRKSSAAAARIRANSHNSTTTTASAAAVVIQQRHQQQQQEFLTAISQARQSDASMDTFLTETEPPLPPRLSKAHSDQTVTNLMRIKRQ